MEPSTFRDVIKAWPDISVFASDMGVSYQRAYGWYRRNSIPPAHWQRLAQTAQPHGLSLSAEGLITIATRRAADAA